MGVDISMAMFARAEHPLAGCRGLVYGSAIYIFPTWSDNWRKKLRAHVIFPLVAVPLALDLADSNTIERQMSTAARFAAEVEVLHYPATKSEKYSFVRWLSQEEYEALKKWPTKRWPWTHPKFNFEDRKAVCTHCPLRYPGWEDCQPQLFGYSNMPRLRQAASEILLDAPFPLYRDVNQLVSDLNDLFEGSLDSAEPDQNVAQEREDTYRHILDSYESRGIVTISGNIEEGSGRQIIPLADALLNVLFFRPSDEADPQSWLSMSQLELFVHWLERLLTCLTEWRRVRPLSAELQYFYEVMELYLGVHQHALHHQMMIGISW